MSNRVMAAMQPSSCEKMSCPFWLIACGTLSKQAKTATFSKINGYSKFLTLAFSNYSLVPEIYPAKIRPHFPSLRQTRTDFVIQWHQLLLIDTSIQSV